MPFVLLERFVFKHMNLLINKLHLLDAILNNFLYVTLTIVIVSKDIQCPDFFDVSSSFSNYRYYYS
jgi:uncharacterized membrane protein